MSTHLSLTGLSPSLAGFPKTVLLNSLNQLCGPNPGMHASRFGLFRFRSPLLTESHVVFSSSGYLDVSVHRVPFHSLWIGLWILEVFSSRFPHSEISGSMDICSSPKLFAAYHVFHRLLVPRHPPYALISITNWQETRVVSHRHMYSVTCVGNSLFFYNVVNITSDVLLNFIQLSYFHKIFLFVCNFQGTSDCFFHQSLETKTSFNL